jgi:uncharacterized protein YgiB involved in biofilm formation
MAMKRSRLLKLAVLGTVGVLAGCEEERSAVVYPSVEACEQAGVLTADICRREFANALAHHQQIAPRFVTLSDCEQDFGPGLCQPLPQSTGNIWIPAMAGFMVASMLRDREIDIDIHSGGSRGSYYSQPLYRTRSDGVGQWRTAGNDVITGTGKTRVASSTSVPQTRAVTMSRSGFGSTASARGSWGG